MTDKEILEYLERVIKVEWLWDDEVTLSIKVPDEIKGFDNLTDLVKQLVQIDGRY